MAIIDKGEFDIEELRKSRARKAASKTGLSKVEGLAQISPDIAKLNIGQTAKVSIPGGRDGLRKTVMGITAKLSFLTCKGGEWEGKDFKVVSDGEEFVYVQRGPNLKGDDIKVRNPTGRPKGSGKKKAPAAETVETTETETETPEEAAEDVVDKGETISAKGGVLITEHA